MTPTFVTPPAVAQLRPARASSVALLDTLHDRGVPVLDCGRALIGLVGTLTTDDQRDAFTHVLDVLNDAISVAIPPSP